MSGQPLDPYSLPISPSWVADAGGERLTVSNQSLRDQLSIPRRDRVLEIRCNRSLIGIVYPRGPSRRWLLRLTSGDEHLWPDDAPTRALARAIHDHDGTEPPADLDERVPFKCVCGRMHVLDRPLVLDTAIRLEPRRTTAPAQLVDFRCVARVLRDHLDPLD